MTVVHARFPPGRRPAQQAAFGVPDSCGHDGGEEQQVGPVRLSGSAGLRGGLNSWARLPDGTDLEQLTRDCMNAGVIIAPGTEWFPAEPTGPFIRLNYAGPNPSAFPEGARILGRSMEPNGR